MHENRNYTISVDVPYGYKFSGWKITSNNLEPISKNKIAKIDVKYYNSTYEFKPRKGDYEITPIFKKIDSLYEHVVPAVRINEMGANKEIAYNDYFEKSDWVELYNCTDSAVNIAGLYISNSEDNPRMYKIPDNQGKKTRIEPYSHCILWADEEPDNREIHLPFKLPSSGGTLILSAYEGDSILLWRDQLVYSAHKDDRSFGRYPNGSDKLHELHHPTPGRTNLYSSYNTFICYDTITGYQIDEVMTNIKSADEEVAEIIEVKYYNLSGQYVGNNLEELPQNVYIRRTHYSNNKIKIEKILQK
jgi:hypothetical protein